MKAEFICYCVCDECHRPIRLELFMTEERKRVWWALASQERVNNKEASLFITTNLYFSAKLKTTRHTTNVIDRHLVFVTSRVSDPFRGSAHFPDGYSTSLHQQVCLCIELQAKPTFNIIIPRKQSFSSPNPSYW